MLKSKDVESKPCGCDFSARPCGNPIWSRSEMKPIITGYVKPSLIAKNGHYTFTHTWRDRKLFFFFFGSIDRKHSNTYFFFFGTVGIRQFLACWGRCYDVVGAWVNVSTYKFGKSWIYAWLFTRTGTTLLLLNVNLTALNSYRWTIRGYVPPSSLERDLN